MFTEVRDLPTVHPTFRLGLQVFLQFFPLWQTTLSVRRRLRRASFSIDPLVFLIMCIMIDMETRTSLTVRIPIAQWCALVPQLCNMCVVAEPTRLVRQVL